MSDERELLKKRFSELANKSYSSGIFLFSDFLGLMELSVFSSVKSKLSGIHYTLYGGADGCERVMVRFGDPESFGYEVPFPIVMLKAEPVSQKFADRLTHRDFLGAILNLGIDRSKLGDIVIKENVGYIFAHEDIADYIKNELTRAKHTELKISVCDPLPDGGLYTTERKVVQANGERIDAVIAKVFGMSRDDALSLFAKKLVFIDGSVCENNSKAPKVGETVSVRGYGRFIYLGYESKSKKGKLNIQVDLYR